MLVGFGIRIGWIDFEVATALKDTGTREKASCRMKLAVETLGKRVYVIGQSRSNDFNSVI